MSPEAINSNNNVQSNWINALEGDKNVTPKEAEAIINNAMGKVGFDDVLFARTLLRQAHTADQTGYNNFGEVYNFEGKNSAKSGIEVARKVIDNAPPMAAQLYNAVAREHPILAVLGIPFFTAYSAIAGE